MHLRPNFLKSKEKLPPRVNSYSQHHPGKLFSRKKVIAPISSETEVLAAAALHQTKQRRDKKLQAKAAPNPQSFSTNNDAHLISGAAAKINAHVTIDPLVSRLDANTKRSKRLVAFVAQVLLWATAFYVLFL